MTVYPLVAWQIQRSCSTSSVATAILMFCWRCVVSPITLKVQCVIVHVQKSLSLSYACTHAASNPPIKFVPTSNRLSVLSCYSCTIHFTSIVPMCTTSVQGACSQLGYHIKTADSLSSFCQHHRTTSSAAKQVSVPCYRCTYGCICSGLGHSVIVNVLLKIPPALSALGGSPGCWTKGQGPQEIPL